MYGTQNACAQNRSNFLYFDIYVYFLLGVCFWGYESETGRRTVLIKLV
jgi:hypothetical protein